MKADRQFLLAAWGIALLAFATRLVYLTQWLDTPLFDVPIGDGRGYQAWAHAIVSGGWIGEEVFYQAPFYPYFLATVYALLGESPWTPRIVQAVLGALACLLLALAGRRFFSPRVGLGAGLLLALYAPALYFDGLLQKASLALFFCSALLWLLAEFQQRPRRYLVLLAGIVMGCLALTRENTLILIPWVALWLWLGFGIPEQARKLRFLVAFGLGVALLLIPVGLRNQALGGTFLITTSQLGPNLFIGNNPQANGRYVPLQKGGGSSRYERDDARRVAEHLSGAPLDPAQVSAFWRDRALAYIWEQPGHWLQLMGYKLFLVGHASEVVDTDSIESYRDESGLLDVLARLFHFGVVAPLALLGLWATRGSWRRLWLLHGILLGLAGSVAIFYVLARYRAPLIPALLLFSSAGLFGLVDALRASRWRELGGALALLVVAGTASNWPLVPPIDPRVITDYALAQGLRERNRAEESLALLDRAIARAPLFVPAHIARGHALRGAIQIAEAEQAYRAALALEPENADALTGLALVQLVRRERVAGRATLDRALEIDPQNGDAHSTLGRMLTEDGEYEQAVNHFERALQALPNDPDRISNLAAAYSMAGEHEQALRMFEALLRIRPGHVMAFFNRAATLERLGYKEPALAAFREFLERVPESFSPEMAEAARNAVERLSPQEG